MLAELVKQGVNKKPWYLIFAVTALCNQRCAMCFYRSNIDSCDRSSELTLEEINKIACRFDNLFQLTLTGGEPLLRNDCVEIACLFANRTPVRRITLTSNGMLPEKIEAFVSSFCQRFPRVYLSVNLSLDGLEKTHDAIRGVPGAFRKVIQSFDLLGSLKKCYANLSRATATTVSTLNQGEVPALLDFVEERLDISSHGVMMARGDLVNKGLAAISLKQFQEVLCALAARIERKGGRVMSALNTTYQKRRIASLQKKRMLDSCSAGKKLLILDEKGWLSPCELLEPLRKRDALNLPWEGDFVLGNLRDFKYDVRRILSTEKAKKISRFIEQKGCWCTFECALLNNFFLNPFNYVRVVPELFRKKKSSPKEKT
jgi:MoaA/NifB/PqqE/SkfB family radical SAM enzyme